LKSVDELSGEIRGPSVLEMNKQTKMHNNTTSSNQHHHQNTTSSSPAAHNHHQRAKSNNSRPATQGEKIQHLKHQIEKQMKAYVKQEEYEEMLKLIKQLNLISADKWQELENEVDKLDYSDVEYKSTRGFVTDDEIAILASDINTPYNGKSINEMIELTRNNSEIRQSTPLIKQSIMTINKNNHDDENMKETKFIELNKNNNNNIENKPNYAFKRSILRKLMIAQRQKFLMKKEQVDFNKMKNNFADTSISNFSQASGFVNCNGEKSAKLNAGTDQNDQNENVK